MQTLTQHLLAALRAVPGLQAILPALAVPSGEVPAPEPAEYVGSKLTVEDRRRMALRPPSFSDLLPYVAYRPDERVFVLHDGNTLGVLFELGGVPTEAQPA